MKNALIDGRYRLVRELGRGAQGATYLAVDDDGSEVALKELDFAGIGSWDSVAVFDREAAVLGGLTHENIPRIVESFTVESDGSVRLFLAQQYVEGDNLRQLLEAGEMFDERRLRQIAADVLDILVYLHGYSPPVLHRDVKPANLIARPDGSISLVDFGAAQGSARSEAVIGTTGYMPAEQLMGRASARSDLYALGATLVHLATRKHPADLGHGLGLRWRRHANLSEKFADWIDRLVAPMAEDRFPSALAAKRALEHEQRTRAPLRLVDDEEMMSALEPTQPSQSPKGGHTIIRSDGRIEVVCHRPNSRRVKVAIVLSTLGIVSFGGAIATWEPVLLLYFVIVPIVWAAANHFQRGTKQFIAHDRGLDVIARSDGVVRRVPLDEISAPDIVREGRKFALVVWRQDGERVDLDLANSDGDLRHVLGVLRDWLTSVRRRENG